MLVQRQPHRWIPNQDNPTRPYFSSLSSFYPCIHLFTQSLIHPQVADNLVVASLSIHGTRSVQKIVEYCVQDDHVDLLVATLEPAVVDLSKNSNGNHVVQKCLKHSSLKVFLCA